MWQGHVSYVCNPVFLPHDVFDRTKEHSSNSLYFQGAQKMGCKSHIEYIIFSEYKVNTYKEGRECPIR